MLDIVIKASTPLSLGQRAGPQKEKELLLPKKESKNTSVDVFKPNE